MNLITLRVLIIVTAALAYAFISRVFFNLLRRRWGTPAWDEVIDRASLWSWFWPLLPFAVIVQWLFRAADHAARPRSPKVKIPTATVVSDTDATKR